LRVREVSRPPPATSTGRAGSVASELPPRNTAGRRSTKARIPSSCCWTSRRKAWHRWWWRCWPTGRCSTSTWRC